MKYLYRLRTVILMLTIASVSLPASGNAPIEAYLDLNPFGFSTSYVPLTRDDVISRRWETWVISSPEDKERLRAILNTGEEHRFIHNALRIVIVDGDDEYLVDYRGGVRKNGVKEILINKDEFIRFQKSLNKEQRIIREIEFK